MTTLVKICGLKNPDALEVALEAGADLVGFVFFPPSPRHLDGTTSRPAFHSCFRAGSTPQTSPRRLQSPVRPASTSPRVSSARPDTRIPTRFAPSSAPCDKWISTSPRLPGAPHDDSAAEHIPR